MEDVGEQQDKSSQWIGVEVEGSPLLDRLVEGEGPGEADAGGEDRPELEVAQVGNEVAGTLLVKIHLFSRVILILTKFGILISTWFQVVPFGL